MIFFLKTILFLCTLGMLSCSGDQEHSRELLMNEQKLKDTLVNVNKYYVQKESDEIDQYIKHKGWDMTETGTGLRYMIYQNGKGEQAKENMIAKVNYTIRLMDGTICYTSLEKGPREFLIGQDHVESGVHEGVQLMHVGDKARFVIPSHLAHGFTGDADKIPSKATLLVEIELLALRSNR